MSIAWDAKNLFSVYLQFKFNWMSYILSSNSPPPSEKWYIILQFNFQAWILIQIHQFLTVGLELFI